MHFAKKNCGGKVTLHALCLDATNGRILWNTELFRPDSESAAAMHRKNSLASGTPVVTADRIFVHFGHMGTAALDLTGKILWRQTGLAYSPLHGNGGSPALVGDLLVINCDGSTDPFVAALDARTGDVRWKTPRQTPAKNKFSFSTPLAIEVDGATQIISAGSGFVAGYDPKDGHEIWRVLYGAGWLTQEGELCDTVLSPGDELRLRGGRTLVVALGATRLQRLGDARPAGVLRRVTSWLRRWATRLQLGPVQPEPVA